MSRYQFGRWKKKEQGMKNKWWDANLDVKAKYNLSALLLALIGRFGRAARPLIEAGVVVNLCSTVPFGSKTPLCLAEPGGEEITELLRIRGAYL
jgi:hypothetical protein